MENTAWQGVMPALMTEMHRDGSLDLDATAVHVEKYIAAGVEGIIAQPLNSIEKKTLKTKDTKNEK